MSTDCLKGAPVDADTITAGTDEIEVACTCHPARAQLPPFYDAALQRVRE